MLINTERLAPEIAHLAPRLRGRILIKTVTAGRTGTEYLTRLFGLLPDVASVHESDPNYVHAMRPAQVNPEVARSFLLSYKLPQIADAAGVAFVETSHLFCKGFLEPLFALGLMPHLILLRRAPRDVAWSLLERRTVPGRTIQGLQYLVHPGDPGVLPLPYWQSMTDYQLCYWYALEIERRQRQASAWLSRMTGIKLFDTSAAALNDFDRFAAMLEAFGLSGLMTPDLHERHAALSAQKHNANAASRARPADLDAQEARVQELVAYYDPALLTEIAARYGS